MFEGPSKISIALPTQHLAYIHQISAQTHSPILAILDRIVSEFHSNKTYTHTHKKKNPVKFCNIVEVLQHSLPGTVTIYTRTDGLKSITVYARACSSDADTLHTPAQPSAVLNEARPPLTFRSLTERRCGQISEKMSEHFPLNLSVCQLDHRRNNTPMHAQRGKKRRGQHLGRESSAYTLAGADPSSLSFGKGALARP